MSPKPSSARVTAERFMAEARSLPDRKVPALRALRLERSRAWRDMPAAFILDVAGRVVQRPDLRWTACELIRFHRAAFRSLDEALTAWLDGHAVRHVREGKVQLPLRQAVLREAGT